MYNLFKSGLLLLVMTLLLVFFGYLLGGPDGATIFFVIALAMNLVSYLFSHKIVIAMYRGVPADPQRYRRLFEILDDLSARAGLPKPPALYILPMEVPNAFATGRSPSTAVVAVTEGILARMSEQELAAVIAHELGHIKHWDMLIQTVVAAMAGAIMWLSSIAKWGAIFGGRDDEEGGGNILVMLVIAILAPIAAMIVQMAISRSREYMADDFSAGLMGSGRPLSDALIRLHEGALRVPPGEIAPATSHMFISPASVGRGFLNLFSTHPSLEARIENLKKFG
ncbi:MAG TPA: M48 family metalloprotease [bacterium]|nr:M48 family metalloprotease [bacterium]